MSDTLDFFFDFSSPYAYLASTQVAAIAARANAKVRYRPMLLGAVFKAIGTPIVPIATFPEPKRLYVGRDLYYWAAHLSVPFRWPATFPMRTLAPLRLAIAAELEPRLIDAIYRAYWFENRDISDAVVLAEILAELGLDAALLARIESPEVKAALIAASDEAIAAGVCGAPSFLVRGHLFWGQDRLDLVERTLLGWEPPTV